MTKAKVYENVWDALEPDPAKRENLKLRSLLMSALTRHIEREGLTQAQAAKLFGVTQPRISNLIHGKIDLFGLDIVVHMSTTACLCFTLCVKKAS
jgi:predicted XRE-type DNA-binding protein